MPDIIVGVWKLITHVTTWYTYPAQPLSPLIYLLWDSFVSMAKHMEFLLNYKISCSDTITSHMGLGTKHNCWYSIKQYIKKNAISSKTGGGDLCMVSIHGSLCPNTQGRTLGPYRLGIHRLVICVTLDSLFSCCYQKQTGIAGYVCMFRVIIKDQWA